MNLTIIIVMMYNGVTLNEVVILVRLEKLVFKSLADTKAHFSEAVDTAANGKHDVIITKNGVPRAVLISYEKYTKMLNFLSTAYELYLMDAGEKAFGMEAEDILEDTSED
ncbi:type II toxin-antitoxin system Phd/YefM family antitoxin [Kosmotoga pacifica]|uniref:type II toxin-antitoxin system Phd/YefM family antitoxin n=1 Tax=Kosmotoga pacifica TaxID=1330330 RepID=UPI0023564A1F|nr:type II toxin-antitoxin system Phd/YefM family antitoxin [Kosmotoga pacifica]